MGDIGFSTSVNGWKGLPTNGHRSPGGGGGRRWKKGLIDGQLDHQKGAEIAQGPMARSACKLRGGRELERAALPISLFSRVGHFDQSSFDRRRLDGDGSARRTTSFFALENTLGSGSTSE